MAYMYIWTELLPDASQQGDRATASPADLGSPLRSPGPTPSPPRPAGHMMNTRRSDSADSAQSARSKQGAKHRATQGELHPTHRRGGSAKFATRCAHDRWSCYHRGGAVGASAARIRHNQPTSLPRRRAAAGMPKEESAVGSLTPRVSLSVAVVGWRCS